MNQARRPPVRHRRVRSPTATHRERRHRFGRRVDGHIAGRRRPCTCAPSVRRSLYPYGQNKFAEPSPEIGVSKVLCDFSDRSLWEL